MKKSSTVNLKQNVLKKIDSDGLKPVSYMSIWGHEIMVWGLWVISIVLGSLSGSLVLLSYTYQRYELYEFTHESLTSFIVDSIPYLWFSVFVLLSVSAYWQLRHTKRGYRYEWWLLIASSLILSVIGASALNSSEINRKADSLLGNSMPFYYSLEKKETELWQAPKEGRIIGKKVEETGEVEVIMFQTRDEKVWQLDVNELTPNDIELLDSKREVRMVGEAIDKNLFKTCVVIPRLMAKEVSSADRKEIRQRVRDFMASYEEKRATVTLVQSDTKDLQEIGKKCAEILNE